MAPPPTDLYAPIDWVERGGQQVPVSIIERVEETLRQGAFLHDAAARIGFPVETLRDWRKNGVRACRALVQGTKRHADLTDHERACGDLAIRMERAEADARVHLLALTNQLARGGLKRKETTTKTIGSQVVEVTEKETTLLPDGRALTWLLEHRWPEDFGRRRVELTGAEGGPVKVQAEVRDRFRTLIEETAAAADSHDVAERLAGTNGNGASGNGHSPNGHHA